MVIVITGPTATGKSKLGVELAKKINGEIINADSTQVYKGLDIGTAKVTKDEMQGIKHHLIDIKNIEEDYTVFDYQKDAREKINEITKKNKVPILVGGTGLYIKAALYDYQFQEKKKINYDNYSDLELYQKLLKIDPNTNIHQNNRRRVENALSNYEQFKEIPSQKVKSLKPLYDIVVIALTTDRENLYQRINKRVDEMFKIGLEKEAKNLYDKKAYYKSVMTPICYKELFEYFDGNITKEEAINLIKKRSRNYAKRQYTWFRHQMNVKWIDVDFNNFDKTIKETLKEIGG